MLLQMYSIRDAKSETFNVPFFQKTHGEAERSFTELVRDPNSMPGKYPDDYDLYHVGVFDDQTGVLTPLDTARHVLKAINVPTAGGPNRHDKRGNAERVLRDTEQ